MKPEAQQIAIAEACGWKKVYTGPMADGEVDDRYIVGGSYASVKDMPDYLNDLNAIALAEQKLTDDEFEGYVNELRMTTSKTGCVKLCKSLLDYEYRPVISSTAAQRSEALLKAVGKWTDS